MFSIDKNQEKPWFEKSNAKNYIKHLDIPDKLLTNIKEVIENGYTVIDLPVDLSLIDNINEEIELLINSGSFKKNPDYYHYNDSPRIIEAWKHIDSLTKIANDIEIVSFLQVLYQKPPLPFSTINFIKSTEQPLHSDYFHFSSIPERYLAGIWIALEDIHPDSGPLTIVPKSHLLPTVTLMDLGVDIPRSLVDLEKNNSIYEKYVTAKVEELGLSIKSPILKKGQYLCWVANLLHGAPTINNNSITRKSMVVHYHFSGCKYYNPGFSDVEASRYQYRKLEIIK